MATRSAPDGAAPRPDIERAILALTDGELLRLRAYARWRVRSLGDRCVEYSHEDLLSEALAAAIEGRRHWYPERVELLGFLFGAMRSIADNWGKRSRAAERLAPHAQPDDMGGATSDDVLSGQPSPEETVIARQHKESVLRLFDDDPVATLVICELDEGASLKDIRTKFGLTRLEYKAALKRLRRKLARGTDGGKNV